MAKGKYEYWLTDDGLLLLAAWARDGLTDEQIAKNMGISKATLYRWKDKYCDICDALKKGKEIVDIEVENALYKKATGYTVEVTKPIKLKEVKYENGRKVSEKEYIEMATEEVYIPPETAAQVFWLKNRRPDKWRDKVEAVDDATNAPIINITVSAATPADAENDYD